MAMTPVAKSIIGVVSSVAATSAVVTPIVVYSGQASHPEVVSPITGAKQSSTVSPGGAVGHSEIPNVKKVSLDELLKQINQEHKTHNNSLTEGDLPWTNKLKTIIAENSPADKNTWQLIEKKWKSCEVPTRYIENFCGYINVHKEGVGYKLKITRDDLKKWKVRVVKNESGRISYYDDYYQQWQPKQQNNFDQLSSFGEQKSSDSDPWQIYQDAIIFPQVEGKSVK